MQKLCSAAGTVIFAELVVFGASAANGVSGTAPAAMCVVMLVLFFHICLVGILLCS